MKLSDLQIMWLVKPTDALRGVVEPALQGAFDGIGVDGNPCDECTAWNSPELPVHAATTLVAYDAAREDEPGGALCDKCYGQLRTYPNYGHVLAVVHLPAPDDSEESTGTAMSTKGSKWVK